MEEERNMNERDVFVMWTSSGGTNNVGVAFRKRRMRASMSDNVRWTLGVYQFQDNAHFMELNNVVTQICPRTIYYMDCSANRASKAAIRKFRMALSPGEEGEGIENQSSDVVEIQASAFRRSKDEVESDVKTILDSASLMHYHTILDLPQARACLGCLIQKLRLTSASSDYGTYELKSFQISTHMRLDRAAVHALNLFPNAQERGKYTSVFGVLDRCVTEGMGKRLLKRWLRQPLMDIGMIQARQNLVGVFVRDDILRQTLREGPLKGAMDIPKSIRKLESGGKKKTVSESSAMLKELYLLYRMAFQIPDILAPLEAYDGENKEALLSEVTRPLKDSSKNLLGLVQLCEHVIDLKRAESMPPEFFVNPHKCGSVLENGDFNLADLSDEIDDVRRQIHELYQDVIDGWGRGLDIKLEDDKVSGFCMRHSKKKQKIVQTSARKAGERLTVIKLVNKGVYVRNDAMTRLSRKLTQLTKQYQRAQHDVVREAVTVALTYAPVFESITSAFARLDVLLSLAHVAAHAPCGGYCRPDMHASGDVVLKAARHPCVELQELPGGGDFIANDYTLRRALDNDAGATKSGRKEDDDEGHFVVMTGPNMGGKSTYIRQLGTIAVMAQIGSYVPCRSARLPVFDGVLARVGAGDYQLRGVSTFMAEMLEAAAILETATDRSLVIIDELGRGTSTYDGFGLAWAIAEHLATKTKSFTLFATHFHEMTAMARQFPGVVNRHVSAHTTDDSITMLYQVKRGPCDRSFGVHVAELAKFPSEVIRDAKRRVEEMEGGEDDEPRGEAKHVAKRLRTGVPSALKDVTPDVNFLKKFVALPFDKMDTRARLEALEKLVG